MTPLLQRMSDAMPERGFATCTQDSYIGAIYRMAMYYRRDPAVYSASEVQAYLLHMVKERRVVYRTMNVRACACRFLYEVVLRHKREVFHFPMAKVSATQPELLSRHEIARLIAWRAIVACRIVALGGQHLECDTCDHRHWHYHSCRNRHCPQCGARAKDAWLQGRLSEVLPVPYAHLVFTLPHMLNGLYGAHPRWVVDTLLACTAQTLSGFAANDKWMSDANGPPAFSLVLHSCTQDLQRHLHLHLVMACGALTPEGQWSVPRRKPDFLFPVHAL